MNFIDYCIATKNYSTLSAINDYMKITTRTFASKKGGSSKGKTAAKIAASVLGAGALGAGGYYAYPEIQKYLDNKRLADATAELGGGAVDMKQSAIRAAQKNAQAKADKIGADKAEEDLEDSKNEAMGRGNAAHNDSGNLAGDGDWDLTEDTKGESRKFSNIYKRYGRYFR